MNASGRWAIELGLSLRVAARYQRAFEFSSPEALKKYLHDHPDADKSKHTVKKPGEHEKKPEGEAKDEHEHEHEHKDEHKDKKPKSSWKDVMKGLSSKAKSFLASAPEKVQKFVHDEEFRFKTLMSAHKSITEAPTKFVKNAWDAAKEEVHEFKEAGQGVSAWMKGKPMSKHQKAAFRKVATHVAIATAAGALGAGIGAGAGLLAKGVMGSFISSTAKKIAIKAVVKRLEHLPTFEEIAHIGHHSIELFSELMERIATQDQKSDHVDPDEVFQMLIAAAVAKELKELEPETVQEALEAAAEAE
jgi:hypothetical protein